LIEKFGCLKKYNYLCQSFNSFLHKYNISLFFDEKGICYVACNSDYVYAVKDGEMIQLTHRGNIVKRAEIGDISGIYAAEEAVLYTDDKYNIVDAENLAEMSIKDFLMEHQKNVVSIPLLRLLPL
jgi:hypothetical protein